VDLAGIHRKAQPIEDLSALDLDVQVLDFQHGHSEQSFRLW